MKSENIKSIMAFAKSEKPMYKLVISVIDVIKEDGTVRTERRAGTKITCIDELQNVYKVDELDESLVRRGLQPNNAVNTFFIDTESEETVENLVCLFIEDESKKQ